MILGVLKDLSHLKVVYMDKNPCFEADEEDSRIKFLAKYMAYYDPTNMPLLSLNGKLITVQEKVLLITFQILTNSVPRIQKDEKPKFRS